MKHVAAPFGGKQDTEKLFTDLQDKAFANLVNRISSVFRSTGVRVGATHGVLGGDLKVSIDNTGQGLEIAAGDALTSSYEYLSLNNTSFSGASSGKDDGFYLVKLRYKLTGSDPVKSVSGYMYAATGTADQNRKTRFEDGYELILESITADLSTVTPGVKEVILGAVRVVQESFSTENWGGAYPKGSPTVVNGIADLREQNRLLLASDVLLQDSEVLFKDRNYVGNEAVATDIETTGDIKITGSLTVNGENTQYTIKPAGNNAEVSSQKGVHQKWFTEEEVPKTFFKYIEADNIKINVAGEYRDVVSTGPPSTTPRNLRIFDIYPTEDPNEKKIYVQIKWNWDALVITNLTTTTITVYKTNHENESINLTDDDISTNVPGKLFYFTGSDNAYLIESVADTGGTYTFTVSGDPSSENPTESFPGRIIDKDLEYYKITFKSAAQQGRRAKEIIQLELSGDFITDPTYIQKLEGGRSWYCTIQAVNNSSLGSVVTMPAGSFDPDNEAGGQDPIEYLSPFRAQLPALANDDGTLDLIATTQGFQASVGGWNGGTNQTRYHGFEILYSATRTITAGTFSTVPLPSDVERRISTTGFEQIYSPYPAQYSIGVRPIQNFQGVGTPVIKEVASGGGGVVPEEQMLFDEVIDIKTTKFKLFYNSLDVSLARAFSVATNNYEIPDRKSIGNKKAVKPTQSIQTIDWEAGVQYVASTHGTQVITPYLVNPTTGRTPKFIEFKINTDGSSYEGKEERGTWAKVTSPTVSVGPEESISFDVCVDANNFGDALIDVSLIEDDNGFETLKTRRTYVKKSRYPQQNNVSETLFVSYQNMTNSTKMIKWWIRAWGYVGTQDSHFSIAQVYIGENSIGKSTSRINGVPVSGGTDYSMVSASFDRPEPPKWVKDGVINETSPTYSIQNFDYYTKGGLSSFKFTQDNNFANGDEIYIGVDEAGRKIATKNLKVDYKITSIQYDSFFVEGVSAGNPGIIRVYPNDSKGSSVQLEVDGIGFKGADTNLPIKLSEDGTRAFTIDAYDPSALGNNRCEITGRLYITGKPIVKDRLS